MNDTSTYLSLEALAATLSLPQTYLRKLAEGGNIPFLNVSGRLRFNPSQVQDALNQLAEKRRSRAKEAAA
jgi:excisionase family DNA binding protein